METKKGKKKRGQRMNENRKKRLMNTPPIRAMEVCGPLTYGDQKLTSKCLLAVQLFREMYTGKKLTEALRHHLHKDIERILVVKRAKKQEEYKKKMRRMQNELNKVTPDALRNSLSYSSSY